MQRRMAPWAVLLGAVAAASAATAMQTGITAQGRPYVSGGVTHEELVALHERRESFNLWVVTAALRSGAHLSDVRVTIRDEKKQTVLDESLDGPWLFINLPLGRYEVQASYNGSVQRRATAIHAGDHHQLFFYFDSGDTVGPDHASPFERNPYGAERRKN